MIFNKVSPKHQIVIDKSFLQGKRKEEIQSLYNEGYSLLMTQGLIFEILTTDDQERAKCFKHIPEIENPFVLLNSYLILLNFEINTKKNWKYCNTHLKHLLNI